MRDLCADERILLKWILQKYCVKVWTDTSSSRQYPVAGSSIHDNEHWNSIEGTEFLEQMSDYKLLKKDFGDYY
jgi:hypothetical protein